MPTPNHRTPGVRQGTFPPATVPGHLPALAAFARMHRERLSGLGILGAGGKLVGSISVASLRGLTPDRSDRGSDLGVCFLAVGVIENRDTWRHLTLQYKWRLCVPPQNSCTVFRALALPPPLNPSTNSTQPTLFKHFPTPPVEQK